MAQSNVGRQRVGPATENARRANSVRTRGIIETKSNIDLG